MTKMRVTGVRSTPVAIPFADPHVTWVGSVNAGASVLVEVLTDDGLVGLGEAAGGPPDIVQLLIHNYERQLIGQNPLDINAFHERCTTHGYFQVRSIANCALGALDMALWDIFGKATGLPLHQLLGGAVRDRISMFGWVPRIETEDMVRDAIRFVERGFSVLYVKAGLGYERDSRDLGAIREAVGPDVAMRIDVNGAWTPAQAIEQIRLLQPFKLDWVEQPAREDDLDGFDFVRKSVGVPLCIDQGAHNNPLAYQAIARRLADFMCTDVHRMGGILETKAVAAMARQANIDICRHASAEYGISATAHLHLAATIPNLTTGNQTYRTKIADEIVNEPTGDFQNGCLRVPNDPGIGVTLNADKVAKYHELYRKMHEGHYRVAPPDVARM